MFTTPAKVEAVIRKWDRRIGTCRSNLDTYVAVYNDIIESTILEELSSMGAVNSTILLETYLNDWRALCDACIYRGRSIRILKKQWLRIRNYMLIIVRGMIRLLDIIELVGDSTRIGGEYAINLNNGNVLEIKNLTAKLPDRFNQVVDKTRSLVLVHVPTNNVLSAMYIVGDDVVRYEMCMMHYARCLACLSNTRI